MESKEDILELDQKEIGLGRTNNTQGRPQLLVDNTTQQEKDNNLANQDACESESRSSTHRIVDSIKERHHDAGVKLRKALHISKTSDKQLEPSSPILANATKEESESRLVHKVPVPEKHKLKDFLHNPVETVKSIGSDETSHQVAANIATKEIPHGQEVDLVNASAAIQSADSEQERVDATQKLSKLLDNRQNTYARWTLDRHVTKVRILPRETFTMKPRSAFATKDATGGTAIDWRAYGLHLLEYYAHQYGGQYIGYGSNPPTPSKETIMPNIERLIVASSPFQVLAMETRSVYRWESTTKTMKYLIAYLLLWYFNILLAGMLSILLYLVAARRIYKKSIEDLRAEIKRREDVEKTALTLTEFIEKKGDENWADELLQSLGPWLMIQLADMANLFETLRNFYEWQNPSQTFFMLWVIGGAILVTALTPTWIIIKSCGLIAGMTFFGLFPLSVEYLDYRLLVSPLKRFLWNIPTHAEWAIKFIQDEAARVAREHNQLSPAPAHALSLSPTQANDYGFYNAHHDKVPGHLVISTDSVRFVSNIGHTIHFVLHYDNIQAVEKQDRVVAKNLPSKLESDSGKDMKLVTRKTGEELVLNDVKERDEAFSQIIGFSQTNWQVVW